MAKTSDDKEIKLMRDYLSGLIRDMRRTMSDGGASPYSNMNASGKSRKALRFDIETTPGLVIGKIYAPGHIIQLEQGRQRGKAPPRDSIRQWIDDKGIIPRGGISKDSLAFLIQRAIKESGTRLSRTKPSGILSDNITDERAISFFSQVKTLGLIEIKIMLHKEFKKIGAN